MLVLARGVGDSIVIGEGITITILKVKGKTIRIGIAAPKEIRVQRNEMISSEEPRRKSPED